MASLSGMVRSLAAADAFQRAFGQIQVFEVLQVFEDGFAGVVGLGAPGAPGELLQAFFDGLRKSNGQHKTPFFLHAIQV